MVDLGARLDRRGLGRCGRPRRSSALRPPANKGHDTWSPQVYLGHKNIQQTVRYTKLSPDRFKDFWR
jgi:hypothetical protein